MREAITTEILHDLMGQKTSREVVAARKSFWAFEQYMNPNFFRDDRPHLKQTADTLQAVYERRLKNPETGRAYRKMMLNTGPRTGKSYTLMMFGMWVYGKKQSEKIISVSYNEILSGRFGKNVRDGIDATKVDPDYHIFSDVFPGVRLRFGDAAAQIWALEGQYFSFLAAGFGGTITGVGASIGVIDDPIKNHIEAANERILDDQWQWYTDTFLSRIEEGGLQIIVMTRWATKDLCGRLLETEPDEWYVLRLPVCLNEDTHEMLCPDLLSWERYSKLRELTSPEIFLANYQQQPIDVTGRLYSSLLTYDDIPRGPDGRGQFEKKINYTDTADEGKDFLCSIDAGLYQGQLWITDVLYSDEGMEVTEPQTADMLHGDGVDEALFESNNGGRGFARNVERLLWERHRSRSTKVVWRAQRQNKEARIITGATWIMLNVRFPEGWERRWPQFYRALMSYQRKGRNAHDDAPDALTGLAEMAQGGFNTRTKYASGRGKRR